jgi:hypothetical protein
MPSAQQTPGPRWTDTPWFWLHLFSLAALAGLMVVGPKYAHRQQGLETRSAGRAAARAVPESRPPAGAPQLPLQIPLHTLMGAVAALVLVSLMGLLRSRHRAWSQQAPATQIPAP